jgi:hypothetical protein
MSEKGEEEKIKKVAELRTRLQKRVEQIETELEELRVLLKLVDDTLLEKGFKRAEIAERAPAPLEAEAATTPSEVAPTPAEYERKIPLKTVTGDLLAVLHTSKDSMQIAPAEDKSFDVKTPPFMSFLVERVLAKMQESDREAATKGEITPDSILSYDIARDGDIIRGVTIRNIRSGRLRELKSAVRWTLEKMYEKTVQES